MCFWYGSQVVVKVWGICLDAVIGDCKLINPEVDGVWHFLALEVQGSFTGLIN